MKTHPASLVLAVALASVLAAFVAACSGRSDTTGASPPSTTIGTEIDDSVVTSRVKSALLADASIQSLDITVVTRKGAVQLSGFVNNQGQIDRALTVTRAVEGVAGVINEMSLKK